MEDSAKNIVPNGNFQEGKLGSLPDNWEIVSSYPEIMPLFELRNVDGRKILQARGNGNENCTGYACVKFQMNGGQSYRMKVRFRMSDGLDPNKNLLFACYCQTPDGTIFNNGIFKFYKISDQWVEGENCFSMPGYGSLKGEVRIYYRLSASGHAWIESISLEECDPVPACNVKVACTSGYTSLETWQSVLDFAGENHTDIVLLPEYFYHEFTRLPELKSIEDYNGPSCTLLAKQARKYGMYTAGTFVYRDESDGAVYNNAVLFDRTGKLLGQYYKNHPFSSERDMGITPGVDVPVFHTDFGCVGMMTCYDSWFSDVAQLLALKGAEIILFPNAGYYRSLMPARAADNCVRIIASSSHDRCSIWDTAGVDVLNPNADPSCHSKCDDTFNDVICKTIENVEIVIATLDLSKSPSPHNWGGPLLSAPGGRRNRREQKQFLWDQIKAESECWW